MHLSSRRGFLGKLSSLPMLSGLAWRTQAYGAARNRDYFKEMNVRTFINAGEPFTTLCGGPMLPEVVQAMQYASKQSVRLNDVHDAVAERLTSLLGCEAVMVTAGAASALTLGTAGCMTGTERHLVRRLPDTSGMKAEVIIHESQRYGYDHAVRNCGIHFVEVGTRQDLDRAISARDCVEVGLAVAAGRGTGCTTTDPRDSEESGPRMSSLRRTDSPSGKISIEDEVTL